MAIQLQNESDILNPEFRKMVIVDIEGDENQDRKLRAIKAHDVYKDQVKKYVLEVYKEEQGNEALRDIQYRAANISFCRSIIDTRSRLYAVPPTREAPGNEEAREQIDLIADYLNLNSNMKKTNRYEDLFKNAMVQVYPYLDQVDQVWKIKLNVLPPFKYDVIEDANNPESARVVILSYYSTSNSVEGTTQSDAAIHSALRSSGSNFRTGNRIDESIADSPNDMGANKKYYIWWSSLYHFTTDENGQIVSGTQSETLENPIGILPFVNFSSEQDGAFWAVGGEDIIDGTVLLNVFLTDLYYIAKYQGMGLFYLFGRGVPKNIKVGPSQAITLEVKEGDPPPQIGFATSNPPIDMYINSIKEYISILFKTNHVRPEGFMGTDSADAAASGIQEMIKNSALIEAQEDKKEIYRDNEPLIFKIFFKWHNLLLERGLLDPELVSLGKIDESIKVVLKFNEQKAFTTELERLEIIQKRKELGLDTLLDSIMKDNPELTKEDAEKKLLELQEQKVEDARKKMMTYLKEEMAPEEKEDSPEDEKEDELETESED